MATNPVIAEADREYGAPPDALFATLADPVKWVRARRSRRCPATRASRGRVGRDDHAPLGRRASM